MLDDVQIAAAAQRYEESKPLRARNERLVRSGRVLTMSNRWLLPSLQPTKHWFGASAQQTAVGAAAAGPPRPGWSSLNEAQRHNMLLDACADAGVAVGAYDSRIVAWLTHWEDPTVAVIAGPLPIIGGSGSPCRVLALVER